MIKKFSKSIKIEKDANSVFFWSSDPKKYEQADHYVFSQWYIYSEEYGDAKMGYNRKLTLPYKLPFIGKNNNFEELLEKQDFICCEQWMMALKALLFAKGDNLKDNLEIFKKIMETDKPKTMKALGRKVKGFNSMEWIGYGYKIVVNGNYMKFEQNENLKKLLLETEDRNIYEASPYDKIWGIGFDPEKAKTKDTSHYGQNLLGKALIEVRELLK